MAADLDSIGIQNWTAPTGAICESIEYEKALDEARISSCTSGFGAAHGFDPITDFTIKGYGDIPAGFTVGTDGGVNIDITGINDGAGSNLIETVKKAEKNDNYNEWEITGKYFPSVTA